MANRRDVNLSDYNISKYAYRELYYFCLQYPEKKRRLNELRNPLRGQGYNGMPHSSEVADPTADAATKAAMLAKDVEMIEQTVIQADSSLYSALLDNAAYGTPFEYLKVPCGRRQFYDSRKKFFFLLHKAREKGNTGDV